MNALLLVLLLLSLPVPAAASVIYDWTGTCLTGCVGTATFHIVTTDAYVPGTVLERGPSELQHPTVLEALYADNNLTHDMAPFNWRLSGLSLALPATPSDGGFLLGIADVFRSDATGAWRFGGENLNPNCDELRTPLCGYATAGDQGVWLLHPNAVPGPPTAALLGLGVLLMAWGTRAQRARARRQRRSPAGPA